MLNWFTLNGVDSRAFGVYLTGSGTYGAPEKIYEEYDVPGRNGLLLGSNRKLGNGEVTYPCAIFGTVEEVEQNLAAFRTFLLSLDGYFRLEDTYHPDEYRMAVCRGPIEPEMSSPLDASETEITFSCLPQRFLKSGETQYFVLGGHVTGSEIYSRGTDLSGTDITIEIAQPYRSRGPVEKDTVIYEPVNSVAMMWDGETIWERDLPIPVMEGTVDPFHGYTITKTLYELPTTGWTKVTGYAATYKISMPYSVVACSFATLQDESDQHRVGMCWIDENLDFVVMASNLLTTVAQFEAWLASVYAYVVVEVQNEGVLNVPPFVFPPEWGTLSVSAGEITIGVTSTPVLTNPTLFPSKPLIRVYGTGSFTVNDITVTVSDCDNYVDIDCDIMDCYEGDINRNGDVSFSSYDFPELVPQGNTFEVVSGITSVAVTPRWWRV